MKKIIDSFKNKFLYLGSPTAYPAKSEGAIVTLSQQEVKVPSECKFTIDTVSNLVFWSRLANKLEHWHNVYMVETWLTEFRIDRIHMGLQKGYVLYV